MSNTMKVREPKKLVRRAGIVTGVALLPLMAAAPSFAVDTPEQTAVKEAINSNFSSVTDLLTTTVIPAIFALLAIVTLVVVGVKYAKKARSATS